MEYVDYYYITLVRITDNAVYTESEMEFTSFPSFISAYYSFRFTASRLGGSVPVLPADTPYSFLTLKPLSYIKSLNSRYNGKENK